MADVKTDRKTNEPADGRVGERANGRGPADGNGKGVGAATDTETREAAHDVEAEQEVTETNEAFDEPTPAPPKKRPLYKRPVFLIVAAVVLVVAAIFGVRYWAYSRTHESTDDAFVDGRVVQISPKVTGYVAKVYVEDNQPVRRATSSRNSTRATSRRGLNRRRRRSRRARRSSVRRSRASS